MTRAVLILLAMLAVWALGIAVGVLMGEYLHACQQRPVTPEDFRER